MVMTTTGPFRFFRYACEASLVGWAVPKRSKCARLYEKKNGFEKDVGIR